MTTPTPPQRVIDAIENGEAKITRRIEIYENDGTTLWVPSTNEEVGGRIVNGSVSVDSTRAERRTLDVTLSNFDKLLRPNPLDGFWYDKVLKVYRGVEFATPQSPPTIALMDTGDAVGNDKVNAYLRSIGFTKTTIDPTGDTPAYYQPYDILMSYTGTLQTTVAKAALLASAYSRGQAIMTVSCGNDQNKVPFIDTTTYQGAARAWGAAPPTQDTPIAGRWTTADVPGLYDGNAVNTLKTGARVVALYTINGASTITASLQTNDKGGRWFDLHLPRITVDALKPLVYAALQWLQNIEPYTRYEAPLGVFHIDGLNDARQPNQIKVTCRDRTKLMLGSKLTRDLTFSAGVDIGELARDLARNSGVTGDINVPVKLGVNTTVALSYAADTDRWGILDGIFKSFGYLLFFDAYGVLNSMEMPDPALSAPTFQFGTGSEGNLASYEPSTNDSNLFNHVVVTGGGTDALPYYGEAKNEDLNSPTRIARIGDRMAPVFKYDSLSSNAQAVSVARKFLAVSALETYELAMTSIVYPWLDAYLIARIIDPNAKPYEPDTYLVDTLTVPLGLEPMSATGKRITKVGFSD